MKERDIEKLVAAGFSIIRPDYEMLRIKIRTGCHSWRTFEKNFGSRAALITRFNELLQHPKNLEL